MVFQQEGTDHHDIMCRDPVSGFLQGNVVVLLSIYMSAERGNIMSPVYNTTRSFVIMVGQPDVRIQGHEKAFCGSKNLGIMHR